MSDVERTALAAMEGTSRGNVAGMMGGSTLPQTKAVSTGYSGKPEVDKLFTLADVDPIGRSEVLIYGPPKSGKTVLWSTFPPPFRVIDADNGLKSVAWAFKAGKTSMKSPTELVGYRPHEALDKPYPDHAVAFDKVCDMVDHWFSAPEVGKWEGGTLVIDSFTEMNEWAINKGLELNQKLPDAKKPLSRSHEINLKAQARLLTGQQDYKSAMAFLDTFIWPVRVMCAQHNRNLVVVCHEYTEETENDSGERVILRYRPLLIGQLRERFPKSFDDLWHMTTYHKGGIPEFKVQMHAGAKFLAGTRWGAIMSAEEEPDYRQMLAKVKAYHNVK